MTKQTRTPEFWADWLVDAIATATQDRRYLRGDEAEDKVATEAIYANGLHAIERAIYIAKAEGQT